MENIRKYVQHISAYIFMFICIRTCKWMCARRLLCRVQYISWEVHIIAVHINIYIYCVIATCILMYGCILQYTSIYCIHVYISRSMQQLFRAHAKSREWFSTETEVNRTQVMPSSGSTGAGEYAFGALRPTRISRQEAAKATWCCRPSESSWRW